MLIKNFSFYFLGTLIASGISFLMLPILTRFLSPYDYGMIATVGIIIQVVSLFALGIGSLIVREAQENIAYMKGVLSSFLLQTLMLALIVIPLGYLFDSSISTFLVIENGYVSYILIISFMTLLQGLFLSVLQALNKAKKYALLSIFTVVFNMSLTIVILLYIEQNWKARIDAMFYSLLLLNSYALVDLYRNHFLVTPTIDGMKKVLSFGLPLLPHTIGTFLIFSSDKYFLNTISTVEITGIYSVALVLMGILRIFVEAMNKALLPIMIKKLLIIKEEAKIRVVKNIYIYDLVLILLAFVLDFISKYILKVFVGEEFQSASEYLIYLYLAASFIGMYRTRVMFIIYMKKNKKLSYRGDLLAATINIILCPILINLNGPIGAAQSTMIAYFVSFLSVWKLSDEIYPMPWLFWRRQ